MPWYFKNGTRELPRPQSYLAPLKFWRPLREERIGPFAEIHGAAAGRDGATLVLHLRFKAILRAERQKLLGIAECGSRSLGDVNGEFPRPLNELRRRKHLVDEAELLG